MEFIHKILYGSEYYHYAICDAVLDYFSKTDHISNEALYCNAPEGQTSVIEFLSSEGMIRIDRYGISITEKGKIKRAGGGYRRQAFWNRIARLGIIIAIISGLISIVVAFLY